MLRSILKYATRNVQTFKFNVNMLTIIAFVWIGGYVIWNFVQMNPQWWMFPVIFSLLPGGAIIGTFIEDLCDDIIDWAWELDNVNDAE